jgi:hypothetical protein
MESPRIVKRRIAAWLSPHSAGGLLDPRWTAEAPGVELDRQEFAELRRMVTDVLISCYFLLRADFLQHLSVPHGGGDDDWTRTESALFCLPRVSREVCARVQARGGGESVRWDQDATSRQLLQFVQIVTSQSSTTSIGIMHPLVTIVTSLDISSVISE